MQLVEEPVPQPDAGQVVVKLTSIGMNQAELMGRQGAYKLSTGDPPFTLGLEGGGVIDSLGDGVTRFKVGDRVTLTPGATRPGEGSTGGAYRTHYRCPATDVMHCPEAIPDDQLGAIWLPYLTAWGCLHWVHRLHERPEDQRTVAIPAASSSLGLAAAQVVKALGGTAIGMTSSPEKIEAIRALSTSRFDELLVTHEPDRTLKPFHRDLYRLTDKRGVDVFFDPVASGGYLNNEIKALADGGTVYLYGLLGEPDTVDVTPLIRKHASMRGWMMTELRQAGEDQWRPECEDVLARFADGTFTQHVAERFKLADVRHAHEVMQQGNHIGKLVLVP